MTKIKIVFVSIFSLMVLVPLMGFRFGEGIVSEIDNRRLQENPLHAEERAKKPMRELVSAYVSDRIGFRDDMILAYILLNDKLFGEMVHPTYCYGKDGFVYFKAMYTPVYDQSLEMFADMVKRLQDYCEVRGVSFVFVFEPFKQRILIEHLPVGVHYDARWVDEFLHALDERGVHYVDNTVTLQQKMEEGEIVFNRQFDAGHWNERGLYYGTNAILAELHKKFSGILPNDINEFETSEVLMNFLPVSKFPIHEYVPKIKVPLEDIEDISNLYQAELERHEHFRDFGYFRNRVRLENTPRTMVFQGSYLSKANSQFLKYALGEYIIVHDYQNVLEFPYYFNIFKPKCVVFEAAEYTINNNYFDEKKMAILNWNPSLQSIMEKTGISKEYTLPIDNISVQQGNALTKVIWKGKTDGIEYAWCILGDEFDMRPCKEGGYEVTVKNEKWDQYKESLKIVTFAEGKLEMYIQ